MSLHLNHMADGLHTAIDEAEDAAVDAQICAELATEDLVAAATKLLLGHVEHIDVPLEGRWAAIDVLEDELQNGSALLRDLLPFVRHRACEHEGFLFRRAPSKADALAWIEQRAVAYAERHLDDELKVRRMKAVQL